MTATATLFVSRQGLSEDDSHLSFLRDVVDVATPLGEYHEDAAKALLRVFTTVDEKWLDMDSILDASELILVELGYEVDWASDGYTILKAS